MIRVVRWCPTFIEIETCESFSRAACVSDCDRHIAQFDERDIYLDIWHDEDALSLKSELATEFSGLRDF